MEAGGNWEEPDYPLTYNNIGYEYLSKGDYDKAIKNYEKAIKP